MLRFRAKPELTIRSKRDPCERSQWNVATEAFGKPVITDLFNQSGLKKRFSADKVENDSPCIPVDEVRIVAFVLVKQVINNFSAGLDAHMLRSLVMLIAIRTPKIAAVRNLKCDIAACTAGFRKVSAVQSLDCISVVLKSLVFQGDGPPPCRNRIGIGHIADRSGQYTAKRRYPVPF